MTGEEMVGTLLNRIRKKRARVGDATLTLSALEQLLCESQQPSERELEPGYPKKMTKARPNDNPWVPKGPEPPMVQWVNNRHEEDEAVLRGFHGGIY